MEREEKERGRGERDEAGEAQVDSQKGLSPMLSLPHSFLRVASGFP